MNVIFLDFDGVIRVAEASDRKGWLDAVFCHDRMNALADLCKDTGSNIVVTSDWRTFEDEAVIIEHLSPQLHDYLHDEWKTPDSGARWSDIECWLDWQDVESFAIVDDVPRLFDGADDDILSRLVLTNPREGITPEIIEEIRTKLQP